MLWKDTFAQTSLLDVSKRFNYHMEIMNRTNNICAVNEFGGVLLCISYLEKVEF